MSRVEIKGKDTNDPSAPEVVLAVTATEVGTSNALDVNVVQTSGAGSTQYTEGDTDASITGNAILWEDAGDTLATVSATSPLPVEIIAGASSGTEYTEGDTDASITGGAVLAEGPSDTLTPLQVDANKNLKVVEQDPSVPANVIDANNSSSTPLAGAGTFNGSATSTVGFNAISVYLTSDVDSATDGLEIQYSTNGTDFETIFSLTLDVSVTNPRRIQIPATGSYVRVNYTNGASAQAEFRLQTKLHNTDIRTSVVRLDEELDFDRDATLVRSLITGESSAGGGSFVNVKVDPAGAIQTTANQDTHDDLNANANIQVGDVDVSNGNPVPVSDAGGSLTVDATDLDIRDLTSASDSVEVLQDTHDDLNANANIQVGDSDVSTSNPIPTKHIRSGTGTHSNVAGSASSVTVLASNANRLGATIYNDSTATLYLKLAATATTTSYTVKMFPEDFYEVEYGYTGIIDGIWDSATGAARVVEFT